MRTVEIQGGISRDHLVTVGRPPAYDQPGGPGVYAALGAARGAAVADARAGTSTAVRLRTTLPVGEPDIRELLTGAGVDLATCTDGSVPRLWILDAPEGRRVLSTTPPSHELDERDDESIDRRPGTTSTDTDVLLRSAPGAGLDGTARPAVVVVDPDQRAIAAHGWDYLTDLAATTDVFVPSRVQLTQLHPDARQAAHELRRVTGRSVVARLDAEGALVLPASGGTWHVLPAPVDLVDTTGAGDSHAGALAAALTTPDDPRSLVNATVVATAVVARTLSGHGPETLATGPAVTDAELAAVHVLEED
ncbi:carbohydrate kinase family protein [Georgenia subflava]|uniref:Carbohydrate kinase PfkB domain-containing protein n=1 Tax=Georgenia subflava TaxID=1622177 RepID=A0A6N7EE29_9MICO|nr:carbohydrate kinase family protein [Georgenia subflava]MPV36270.1 hypothetical protein [Georgenia subflava]